MRSHSDPTPAKPRILDDRPCDECGAFDALEIAGRHLCPDCITAAGCSCAGPADNLED